MKKHLMMFASALLISNMSFANQPANTANVLGAAWKAQQSLHAKQTQNGFTMVYGGEDISRKPTLIEKTTTA